MSEWVLNPVTGGDTRTVSVSGPEHVWDVTAESFDRAREVTAQLRALLKAENCTTPYFAEAQFQCDRDQIALWRKELGKQ